MEAVKKIRKKIADLSKTTDARLKIVNEDLSQHNSKLF
jgi:hypothetical protein